MAVFTFAAQELSLPVSRFIINVNRVTGPEQEYCSKVHIDGRQFKRFYVEAIPGTFPPVYSERNDSKVFIQEISHLAALSLYRATFTAEFNNFSTQANKTTTVTFNTPADSKSTMDTFHLTIRNLSAFSELIRKQY